MANNNRNIQNVLTVFVFVVSFYVGNAQIRKENLKLGFSYGFGAQDKAPFNSKNYAHTVAFYKAEINYKLKQKKRWGYEINLEPAYYVANHELINPWFIKGRDYKNYLELRTLFSQKRRIREYALNCGFIVRYNIFKRISTYALGSVGPMTSNNATERLAKGFAFSDIFGLGLSYSVGKTLLNFVYSVRHTSNLGFKQPNSGHDTTNIEFSMLFDFF